MRVCGGGHLRTVAHTHGYAPALVRVCPAHPHTPNGSACVKQRPSRWNLQTSWRRLVKHWACLALRGRLAPRRWRRHSPPPRRRRCRRGQVRARHRRSRAPSRNPSAGVARLAQHPSPVRSARVHARGRGRLWHAAGPAVPAPTSSRGLDLPAARPARSRGACRRALRLVRWVLHHTATAIATACMLAWWIGERLPARLLEFWGVWPFLAFLTRWALPAVRGAICSRAGGSKRVPQVTPLTKEELASVPQCVAHWVYTTTPRARLTPSRSNLPHTPGTNAGD